MLAAQGIAVAHDIGDSHGLQSHPCSICIIGNGLGTAVTSSYETPLLQTYTTFAPIPVIGASLTPRINSHCPRAPPASLRNT